MPSNYEAQQWVFPAISEEHSALRTSGPLNQWKRVTSQETCTLNDHLSPFNHMVSYRWLLIKVLHLQQKHLIHLFSPNSKSEFGMLKRSSRIDKFVISTIPSSCYKINQNKFIVCVCLHLVYKCRDLYRQAEGDQFLWVELLQHSLCVWPPDN